MEENEIQINGGIAINFEVIVKNIIYVKDLISNPATCSCENGKYLANIVHNLIMPGGFPVILNLQDLITWSGSE